MSATAVPTTTESSTDDSPVLSSVIVILFDSTVGDSLTGANIITFQRYIAGLITSFSSIGADEISAVVIVRRDSPASRVVRGRHRRASEFEAKVVLKPSVDVAEAESVVGIILEAMENGNAHTMATELEPAPLRVTGVERVSQSRTNAVDEASGSGSGSVKESAGTTAVEESPELPITAIAAGVGAGMLLVAAAVFTYAGGFRGKRKAQPTDVAAQAPPLAYENPAYEARPATSSV